MLFTGRTAHCRNNHSDLLHIQRPKAKNTDPIAIGRYFFLLYVSFYIMSIKIRDSITLTISSQLKSSLCLFGSILCFFCRISHLLNIDVTVASHAGTGRYEFTDDDIFLKSEQMIDLALDSCFGEDTCSFLE